MAGIVALVMKLLCAKLLASLFLKILSKILYRSMEDYKLVDDVQEGFVNLEALSVRCLKSTVSWQKLCKTSLYVLLCLDVKNASMLLIIKLYSLFLRPKVFLLLTMISFVSCITGPSCQ